MTDDMMSRLLADVPERAMILLEDIDGMFSGREKLGSGYLTFSGFLNALDGIKASEGQILYMTTNHLDRLDPALIRPGRIDVRVLLNLASEKQIKEMFLRFYPDENELVNEFLRIVPACKLSMAKLQGHLLLYRESALECVKNASQLIQEDLSKVKKNMTISEWLHRLNLIHLLPAFEKVRMRRVEDLVYINDEELIEKWELH